MQNELCRVLIKGGILSPSELKQITNLIKGCGLDYLHFGSRQDILFPKTDMLDEVVSKYPQFSIEELMKKKHHNIVSSYVASEIFPSTSWLTGTSYLYILEQFRQKPLLEINITDPQQRLVPLFSGNLNFIASQHDDYWYLFVDLPNFASKVYYPVLVHTWDIAKITYAIEALYTDEEDINVLFRKVNNSLDTQSRTIDNNLIIPFYPFPYYEGMNRMGLDQYWLGLYWRNNKYSLGFLTALCDLCFECQIGKLCITPWKSIIIKGIKKKDKLAWEKLLGSWGINVRHSSLELNWHLPVNDIEALDLKRFLVRSFDQNDISTYGLTFGITSIYSKNFTSVVIEKNPLPETPSKFEIRPTYNVKFSENFDPNQQNYKAYAQDVDKIELPNLLMELSQHYFEQFSLSRKYQEELKPKEKSKVLISEDVYQCKHCLTIYDPKYGDAKNNIAAGTAFEEITGDYLCPTCDAKKEEFVNLLELNAPN